MNVGVKLFCTGTLEVESETPEVTYQDSFIKHGISRLENLRINKIIMMK